MSGTQRERLHWSFELGGASHELDLLADLAPSTVTVVVDGRVLTEVDKPTPERPWVEQTLDVAGETAVLAVTSGEAIQSDLFVRGVSLIDGRSLDDARASAPTPVRGYAQWFGDFGVCKRRPSRGDLAGEIIVLVVGGVILTALLWAQGHPLDRALGGAVIVGAILVAWQAAVIAWIQGVAWVNSRLLRRRELSDALRLLMLAGSFVAIPAATILAIVIVLTVVR